MSIRTTVTPIVLPSLTPFPTIQVGEIEDEFISLMTANGGCRLPCFWGMTPGETTVAELFQFTRQFTAPGFELFSTDNGGYIFRYIATPNASSRWVVQFFTNDEEIRAIDLIAETAQSNFPLSEILSEYGMPEKVLVGPKAFEALPMIVLYEGQHIMGHYYLYPDTTDESLYCYSPGSTSQEVVLWAPNEDWRSFRGLKEEQLYKPLDEVSDYDIPSLHDILKNPNRGLCMKIQPEKILP